MRRGCRRRGDVTPYPQFPGVERAFSPQRLSRIPRLRGALVSLLNNCRLRSLHEKSSIEQSHLRDQALG